jgi:DNA adenine methylase
MTTTITRPALRYFGGKWRLAPWIMSHFPAHECYVEPFGGAASVLLRKQPSFVEVYGDLDDRLVNFFEVLRNRADELMRVINLTPYSEREYLMSMTRHPDALEDARRYAVMHWQAINPRSSKTGMSGFRRIKSLTGYHSPADDWCDMGHLLAIAERMKRVQIECRSAFDIIGIYDGPQTLFYVDPPYVHSTRVNGARQGYAHEMTDGQHEALAAVLKQCRGMVVLSGYSCEMYDRLYDGWVRREQMAKLNGGTQGSNAKKTEVLWINSACADRMNQRGLFEVQA